MTVPSETLSPTPTLMSLMVPAKGAGTSMVALSDSRVISESSFSTVSPALTRTSMTSTSSKSPMSGTLISLVSAMIESFSRVLPVGRRPMGLRGPPPHAVTGFGLSGSMPYFWIAFLTVDAGTSPSSANAFSAAMVIQ